MATKGSKGLIDDLGELLGEIYKDLKKDVFSKIPEIKSQVMKQLLLAKKQLVDEKVAIIGPPATGKTSLLKVLRDPNIEMSALKKYEKTETDPYEAFQVKRNVAVDEDCQTVFSFKVAAGIDNGGEDYIREGHWLEAISKSSIIFYLFDFEKFNHDKTSGQERSRILKDFDWIAENVNELQPNFKIVLLGNKADCFCSTLPEFRNLQEEKRDALGDLHSSIVERMPKGYSNTVKKPCLISLFDKKIRNEQFTDLMLAVMGTSLVDIVRECNDIKKKAS